MDPCSSSGGWLCLAALVVRLACLLGLWLVEKTKLRLRLNLAKARSRDTVR